MDTLLTYIPVIIAFIGAIAWLIRLEQKVKYTYKEVNEFKENCKEEMKEVKNDYKTELKEIKELVKELSTEMHHLSMNVTELRAFLAKEK